MAKRIQAGRDCHAQYDNEHLIQYSQVNTSLLRHHYNTGGGSQYDIRAKYSFFPEPHGGWRPHYDPSIGDAFHPGIDFRDAVRLYYLLRSLGEHPLRQQLLPVRSRPR